MIPATVPGLPAATTLLPALLDLLPTGVVYYAPVLDAGGQVVDFRFVTLNAAAQRLLGLPAQPNVSYQQQWPASADNGAFAFHRDAFLAGTPAQLDHSYLIDGGSRNIRAHATRVEDGLLVSLTESQDPTGSAADLRASQDRELAAVNEELRASNDEYLNTNAALSQAQLQLQQLNQELERQVLERTQALRHAHAATEREREQLYQVFEQTPVAIAILRGPNLRVELANPAVAAIWGREPAQVLGRPYFEAVPDTAGQGFEQILAEVLTTGQPFRLTEAPVTLQRGPGGQPDQAYVNFVFQPLRDAAGTVTGLVASGTEVTEQVRARQQVQHRNEGLTTSNEALEARVQARTKEAQQAQAAAERQQRELVRLFEQAPVAIAVYRGPHYVIELANPVVCRLWGRTAEQIIGKGLFEALPEVAGMGYEELLDGVMMTGKPHVAHAMPAVHEREGRRDTVYWDFVYVPMYEDDGRIYGAMVVATEVTEQVRAREQLQQLNEELETRVATRTAEAQVALREAQDQREQLREQQSLLRQILTQVPAAVATLSGPEHRFAFFNDRYAALTGQRAALHQAVADTLPEVVEQGFIGLLDHVYTSGEPFIGKEIAILLDQPDGPPRQQYLDFTYQALTDRLGERQGILVFAIDVSEQVRTRRQADTLQAAALAAVQRRAQQRQELYQVFAQAPVAIVLLREPDHRIDYYNPAFEELFPPDEWTGDALHGHTVGEVYPRLKPAGLAQLLDRVFETGETQVVIDMPLADLQPGSPRHVTLSYQAYREDGRIVGVAAFAYDVTEQVRGRHAAETMQAALLAEAQRRARERQELLHLFGRAPVAVALLREPDHRIEYFNAAFQQLYPAKELLGRLVVEAYPGMATSDVMGRLDRVYQTGETYRGTEDLLRTATPVLSPRYINFVYQAYYEQDRIAGVAVFIHEVTEQVLARQRVQELNKELAAINEEMQVTNEELNSTNSRLIRTNTDLDTFVYTASHDLKSPIANIEGLLLALRQQLPADALKAPLVPRLFDMMEGSVARFQQTIGHLTNISQLQQAEAPESVDLTALIEGVRLDLAPLLETTPIAITVAVKGCEAVRVAPKTLRSVVYNLLSNAVKYRALDRPAEVQLRAHCTAGHLVLAVQDNGLGLTDAQQGELFGMFRRLHTHVEGSGVGLFMVKRLVDNADGTITVESQAGVGSTFTVSLPA
jgi:PAS domain S-box-containing protein